MSELQPVLERLTKLETREDEKWIAHDKRSDERYDGIRNKLTQICRKIDMLPCHQHAQDVMLNTDFRKKQQVWLGAIWAAITGGFVKMFFFNK